MCQYIESIWIHNGRIMNLTYHQLRYNLTYRNVFGTTAIHDLHTLIDVSNLSTGEYKCRVIYDANHVEVTCTPYVRKKVTSAKLVYEDAVNYSYKSLDRNKLELLFEKKEMADEILIVKNNLIADAFNYNVVIQKNSHYFTPSKPLLQGVMRQTYIDKGIILPKDINVQELLEAENCYLINALNPLEYVILQNIIP